MTFIGNMVLVCSNCVLDDRTSADNTIWRFNITTCLKECVEDKKYGCKFMVIFRGGGKWQCEMRKEAKTYKTVSNTNDPSYAPLIYKQGV